MAEKRLKMHETRLQRMFNSDQLKAMTRSSARGMMWEPDTIKKALRLRFSCGGSGYNEILSSGIPLPAIRTLQKRLQSIPFSPGVLPSVFNYLQEKVCLLYSITALILLYLTCQLFFFCNCSRNTCHAMDILVDLSAL